MVFAQTCSSDGKLPLTMGNGLVALEKRQAIEDFQQCRVVWSITILTGREDEQKYRLISRNRGPQESLDHVIERAGTLGRMLLELGLRRGE
jgi:hypothetical protein